MINLGFYSGKNLPNVRLYPTLLDRILETVALVVWVITCVAAIFLWIHVQDDKAKTAVIVTMVVGTLAMILMAYSAYSPVHLFKFPFRVTERTVVVQYLLATRWCRMFNIIFGLILLSVLFKERASVFGGLPAGMFDALIAIPVILLVLTMAVYYVFAYRNR